MNTGLSELHYSRCKILSHLLIIHHEDIFLKSLTIQGVPKSGLDIDTPITRL